MKLQRPVIGSTVLSVIVAVYVLFLNNATFWSKISGQFAGHPLNVAILGTAVLLLYIVFLVAFSAPYVIKPVFMAVVMISAGVAYFTDTFGTILDRDMIQNIAQTTGPESSHLITSEFLLQLLLFGVVPSLLIAWVRIKHKPFWQKVRTNTVLCLGLVALSVLLVASNFRTYIPFWQHERKVTMVYLNPAMALVGSVDYGVHQFRDANIVAQPYGEDARQGPRLTAARKKTVLVLVVGETARAQNFSLNGYARDTNPELAARNVIAFQNVTSCGTATAVSMPCMFSHLGRDNYSKRAALGSENLVDVLRHAGLTVEWWENNTGTKNIADRVPTMLMTAHPDPKLCSGGECLDQVLVDKLTTRLDNLDGNAVLILHTMGSHGPAYYQRYPESFERFKPACRTAELANCSAQELTNVYDNTILYTDHILAAIIDVLKQHGDAYASAMYYMSDHGESLGENGLYLHGAPYLIAPETQTSIPFIVWFSDDFVTQAGLDLGCLGARTEEPLSHDNMFDTVLGLMDVQTKVYDAGRDAFAACRSQGT
ncbi:sulfatase [Mesorhizobium sp. Root157]|uniref:phosphoethanolamine transferase n=1 Tax=Mesorhizobium sp. Root157 TaxID=1736477 RepID=UPI0006F60329|nr:phosphoethanolamine--lipid A transferase [Mesorhizobium sp. Root157]KQZ82864.1 sulfatase [Mesorhizobium sp. Root157]